MGIFLSWGPRIASICRHPELAQYSHGDGNEGGKLAGGAADGLCVQDQVLAVDRMVVERAKQILLGYRQLSASEAVHLSVMEQNGIERILSFDLGFDVFPRITRLA